ncbi:hypothetical protein ONS96_008663 [Cadophora gregata f. sp. sojae]|nr:hypothetical protein ONS96_008663 [Cadophora gregata f. sp. sojae]
MGNSCSKLPPRSGKDRSTTASAVPLSDMTIAAPSSMREPERHPDVAPNLHPPAHMGPASTGPLPPGANPDLESLTEPGPEARQESQPARTSIPTMQPQTAPATPDVLQQRTLCVFQAMERLEVGQPEIFKQLVDIKSTVEIKDHIDPSDLLDVVLPKMRDVKQMPKAIENTIRYILQFKDMVSAAATIDPHKIAPVVWRGFCLILETCLGDSALVREELRELEKIISNLRQWTNIELLYLGKTKNASSIRFKDLEPSLVNLQVEILKLEAKLFGWISTGRIAQLLKTPERSATWKELVSNINANHDICKSNFDRCKLEDEIVGSVKKWVWNFRPEQAHDDALERTGVALKYRACGQWLLDNETFKTWASTSKVESDGQIIWLRGTTGTGKSTLLCRIIQWHLDTASLYPGTRFAYFYCSRGTATNSKHSWQDVLRAILQQSAFDPKTGKISPDVLDAYTNSGGASSQLRDFSFTNDCERLLHSIVKSGVKLRIMIDALDECDEPKKLLAALVKAFKVVPGGLELLMSSRYEVRVHEKFVDTPMAIIDLRSSVSETDMYTYISTEVKEREDDERLLGRKYPELEDKLIKILCERAGGMFRWVQLQLSFFFERKPDILFKKTAEDHLKKLDTGSVADDNDLNLAYKDIFERNTAPGSAEYKYATSIYRILLCSFMPLSIAMIIEAVAALGIDTHNVDDTCFRRLTADFVVENASSGKLEFAHVSVKDYLQGRSGSQYSKPICHAQVALMCIKCISSQTPFALERIARKRAFFWYASDFWGEHCRESTEKNRKSLAVSNELDAWMLQGLGSTTFESWVTWLDKSTIFLSLSSGFIKNFKASNNGYLGRLVLLACYWNLTEVLRKLLSAHPAPHLNLSVDDCTYKQTAVSSGKILHFNVELVNTADQRDWTPLHWASWRGQLEVVKLLLENNADIQVTDKNGDTPLHEASSAGRVEVIKLLLEKMADVQAVNNYRRTPLHEASSAGSIDVVKLLLEKGADIQAVNKFGNTPLHNAILEGKLEVVKLLLEKKADIQAVNKGGKTPLDYASEYNRFEVVELLEKEAEKRRQGNR